MTATISGDGTSTLINLTTSGNTILGDASTDTLNVGNGGLVKDASGNVGIGTSSPGYRLDVASGDATGGQAIRIRANATTGSGGLQFTDSGATSQYGWIKGVSTGLTFSGTGSENMRIDSSGNVGIGSSSPNGKLQVLTGSAPNIAEIIIGYNGTSVNYIDANTNIFRNGSANEVMRIDSSGNLLVGATSTPAGTPLTKFHVAQSATDYSAALYSTSSTAGNNYGLYIRYSVATPNGTGNSFLVCEDSTTTRFIARSNGGLANYSANNVNLSDERTKTDIQNAGNYLAKICAIPVRTFKYKDQTDDLLNLGCIAQEVEAVAPELVDVSGFGETPEDGVPLKAIYQTDLQYALMKCIQEQQALIQQLQADVEALKDQP